MHSAHYEKWWGLHFRWSKKALSIIQEFLGWIVIFDLLNWNCSKTDLPSNSINRLLSASITHCLLMKYSSWTRIINSQIIFIVASIICCSPIIPNNDDFISRFKWSYCPQMAVPGILSSPFPINSTTDPGPNEYVHVTWHIICPILDSLKPLIDDHFE